MPHGGVLSHSAGHVEYRAHFVFAYDRVEEGFVEHKSRRVAVAILYNIDCQFADLTNLLIERHTRKCLLDFPLDIFVARNGRAHCGLSQSRDTGSRHSGE